MTQPRHAEFEYNGRTYAVESREPNWPSVDGTPEFYVVQTGGRPPSRAVRLYSVFTPPEVIHAEHNALRIAEGLEPL